MGKNKSKNNFDSNKKQTKDNCHKVNCNNNEENNNMNQNNNQNKNGII